jgi:hypothetical protein
MKYLEIRFDDIIFVLIDVVIFKFIVIGVELGLLHDLISVAMFLENLGTLNSRVDVFMRCVY